MPEPRPQPERIDLSQADDPRDVVHRAVACLAQGGIVGLATETVYGLAASALQPAALVRLRDETQLRDAAPLTLLLRGSEEVPDWVAELSALGRRLARRVWPGPVTLVFPRSNASGLGGRLPTAVARLLFADQSVRLRVPSPSFVREVLRLTPGPVVLCRAGNADHVAATADTIAALPSVNMLVDEGPTYFGRPATTVLVENERWQIVRPGVIDEPTITRLSGTIVLFVCTGNTCRSPMAEALCKMLLAKRLKCRHDELEARGFVILSAGVAASNGMPAAANAVEVVRARGASLQQHASRQLSAELVRHADVIVAMTNDHLEALLEHAPDCAPRARLLHPHGADVADPVGCDRETYERTAEDIEGYLELLLSDLGLGTQRS